MDNIAHFIGEAYSNGMFVLVNEGTPERLLETLSALEGANDGVKNFLRHASKTAFLNLTVVEVLCGKCKESKLRDYGVDYLQVKLLALPFPDRIAKVLREARWWDDQLAQHEQQTAYRLAGDALAEQRTKPAMQ